MRHPVRTFTRALTSVAVAGALVVPLTGTVASTADAKAKKSWSSMSRAAKVMNMAWRQTGKPYKYGAKGPSSFDCAGFVQYVYKRAGKHLGRTSGAQATGKRISKHDRRKGDILVFSKGGRAYHSAIYAGNNTMYEAQKSGTKVGRHKIWSSGYKVYRPGW